MKNKLIHSIKLILIAFVLSMGISVAYGQQWSPQLSPTGCVDGEADCEAPLNIGQSLQNKKGGLIIGANIASDKTALNIWSGKVGVGIPAGTQPSSMEMLDAEGYVNATGLCMGHDTTEDCRTAWPSSSTSGSSAGAVVAFNGSSCPSGWSRFEPATGRSIIGVGNNGIAGSQEYLLGAQGGNSSIVQQVNQMPAHTHVLNNGQGYAKTLNSIGTKNCNGIEGCNNGLNFANNASFSYPNIKVAGGAAMNIMNPYIVLTYCKKN